MSSDFVPKTPRGNIQNFIQKISDLFHYRKLKQNQYPENEQSVAKVFQISAVVRVDVCVVLSQIS